MEMEPSPCLLCLSSNFKGGNKRRISSLLNLVKGNELTKDVPGRDDARLVVCPDCDKLLDSATVISNSISQLQIKLRIKINDIRAVILKSGKNFGDGENNLNVEISKMRNNFLECSGDKDKANISEIEGIERKPEVEVDNDDDFVCLTYENTGRGHDPLITAASVPEPDNELEIEESQIEIEISEENYLNPPKATQKRQTTAIVPSPDENEPKSKLPKIEPPTKPKSLISMSYSNIYGNSGIVQKAGGQVTDDQINFQEQIEALAKNNSPSDPCVKIMCRSIRVGDYKCIVSGGQMPIFAVYITKVGIMFTVTHSQKRNCLVKCAIPFKDILLVESHNTRKLSVLFIDTGPEFAKNIRKLLGLSEDPKSEGAFFCPSSGDQYQKRITLVAEAYNSEAQGIIDKIFGRTVTNLDFQTANKKLVNLSRPSMSA